MGPSELKISPPNLPHHLSTHSQADLMRHTVTAHRQAKLNVESHLRERNKQLVALHLRLEQQKRRPGATDISCGSQDAFVS